VEVAVAVVVMLVKVWAEARPARARTKAEAYILMMIVGEVDLMGEVNVELKKRKLEAKVF